MVQNARSGLQRAPDVQPAGITVRVCFGSLYIPAIRVQNASTARVAHARARAAAGQVPRASQSAPWIIRRNPSKLVLTAIVTHTNINTQTFKFMQKIAFVTPNY